MKSLGRLLSRSTPCCAQFIHTLCRPFKIGRNAIGRTTVNPSMNIWRQDVLGFMPQARGHRGFSLVELMIVVAIIGVLTAIAIPNFQAFQRRSRQSEAKAALTSIYTAEQTFHSSWEVYTGSLIPAGYNPSGEYRYQIGFNDMTDGFCGNTSNTIANAATIMCGPAPGRQYTGVVEGAFGMGAEKFVNLSEICGGHGGAEHMGVRCNFSSAVAGSITQGSVASSSMMTVTPPTIGSGEITSVVDINDFQAGAVADLLGLGDDKTKHDVWSINQEKELVHHYNGAQF